MSGSDCLDGRLRPRPTLTREERLLRDALHHARSGDQRGLRYLYLRYGAEVYRYVLAIVRDHHEAEDITHNVFAKLIDSLRLYEPGEAPFKAWVIRIARNVAVDHLRAKRPVPTGEFPDLHRPEEPADGALRSALAVLPRDQREVLVMRHVVGLSPTEIAAILGKSESSVHGLHNRGRRTLKATLSDLGAAPAVAVRVAR